MSCCPRAPAAPPATGVGKDAAAAPHTTRYQTMVLKPDATPLAEHLLGNPPSQASGAAAAPSASRGIDASTAEKAAAAKAALEARIVATRQEIEERSSRAAALKRALAGPDVSAEEAEALRAQFSADERAILRESRRRLTLDDFDVLAIVNRGAFGEVRLVRERGVDASGGASTRLPAQLFAMKVMRKSAGLFMNHLAHIRAEKEAMAAAASSPGAEHIIRLHASLQTDELLVMLMDFAPGGDLMGLLCDKGMLPEALARFYAAEAIQAIAHVHALGFIHRDIKPDNFLIDGAGHLKLSDFGLAKRVHGHIPGMDGVQDEPDAAGAAVGTSSDATHPVMHRPRHLAYTAVGTPDYADYQVLLGRGYGKEADWWSLGAVLYECLLGFPPFHADDAVATCTNIIHYRHTLRFPPGNIRGLSSECVHFLRSLLTDVNRRLGTAGGVAEIRAHPWFAGNDWGRNWERLHLCTPPWIPPRAQALQSQLDALLSLPRTHPAFNDKLAATLSHFGEQVRVIRAGEAVPDVDPPRVRGAEDEHSSRDVIAADAAPGRAKISRKAASKVPGYTFKPPRPSPKHAATASSASQPHPELDAVDEREGVCEGVCEDDDEDDEDADDFRPVSFATPPSAKP